MFVYQFLVNGSSVLVKLEVQSAHQFKPLEFEGEEEAVEVLKEWFSQALGAFAHHININSTSALDLNAAATAPRAAQFSPKRISGGELLVNAGRGVPPGTMT